MRTNVRIDKITMNDNETISFGSNSINVFVGANNVGKSAILAEIYAKSKDFTYPTQIIKDISLTRNGTKEDFLEDLKDHSKEIYSNGTNHYQGFRFDIYSTEYPWENITNQGLRELAEFLTFSLNTEERIRSSNSPGSIDFIDNPPNHLIHLLATKDIIYEEFRKQFKKAFNNHIILNHRAGSILPLHIGKRVPILEGEDRVSSTYIERLNKLPRIETQGDGMRSFTGILLTLLCTPQQILFIDEPEAFLHPPQARLLGEIIGKNEQGRQIFIATHSIDFILGLLNSDGDTSIIRVEREGDLNPTVDINEEKIKTIWQDPLLRYSNILDGLFYNQVVICESESDSMFYQAMISEEDSSRSVFFTNANGKGQMKKIIDAFKLTGIQIDIIVDIDILMNNETLKKIYESLGGQWEEISSKYNQIKTFLDAKTVAPSRESICELLSPIITSDEKNIKEEDKRILKQAVEKTKNTKVLKTLGIRIFNEDSVINQVFLDLNQKFREKGLHIVPVGELEGFDTEISGHGPKWAIKAIDKFSNGENYQEAKNFILSIINP